MSIVVLFGVASSASATENTTTMNTSAIACVKDAVVARETALGEGWSDFSEAVMITYETRKEALTDAYGKSTVGEIKNAVKEAWKNFKNDVKGARADWKNERKDIWAEFKADRKACRATNVVDDSTNQSADVQ